MVLLAWNTVIDRNRTLYIAETGNNRVLKWIFDVPEGTLVVGGVPTIAGANGVGNTDNQSPHTIGLAFDS